MQLFGIIIAALGLLINLAALLFGEEIRQMTSRRKMVVLAVGTLMIFAGVAIALLAPGNPRPTTSAFSTTQGGFAGSQAANSIVNYNGPTNTVIPPPPPLVSAFAPPAAKGVLPRRAPPEPAITPLAYPALPPCPPAPLPTATTPQSSAVRNVGGCVHRQTNGPAASVESIGTNIGQQENGVPSSAKANSKRNCLNIQNNIGVSIGFQGKALPCEKVQFNTGAAISHEGTNIGSQNSSNNVPPLVAQPDTPLPHSMILQQNVAAIRRHRDEGNSLINYLRVFPRRKDAETEKPAIEAWDLAGEDLASDTMGSYGRSVYVSHQYPVEPISAQEYIDLIKARQSATDRIIAEMIDKANASKR